MDVVKAILYSSQRVLVEWHTAVYHRNVTYSENAVELPCCTLEHYSCRCRGSAGSFALVQVKWRECYGSPAAVHCQKLALAQAFARCERAFSSQGGLSWEAGRCPCHLSPLTSEAKAECDGSILPRRNLSLNKKKIIIILPISFKHGGKQLLSWPSCCCWKCAGPWLLKRQTRIPCNSICAERSSHSTLPVSR